MVSAEFAKRPLKKLCLFDVDGTLTPARQVGILSLPLAFVLMNASVGGISRDYCNSFCITPEIGHWIRWRFRSCQDRRTASSRKHER